MKFHLLICVVLITGMVSAQNHLTYQLPPQEIIDLVDAPSTPSMRISPGNNHILLIDNPELPTIADLAAEELRIGGIRIDPATNGRSRSSYGIGLSLTDINGENLRIVGEMPENAKIRNTSWSHDERYIAFNNVTENGIEMWVVEVATAEAQRLPLPYLNDVMGSSMAWLSNSKQILFKAIPEDRGSPPVKTTVAEGPIIQESLGRRTAVRTYQDLINNPYEEELFDYYATAQLFISDIYGNGMPIGDPGVIWWYSISPDGNYILVNTIEKPYSYIVPYSRFSQKYEIYDTDGNLVRHLADIPVADDIPQGFDAVRKGMRSPAWRSDSPSSLYWIEAIDEGDPAMEATYRDQLFFLEAPFDGNPVPAFKLEKRFSGIVWGKHDFALISEYWRSNRRSVTYAFDPSNMESGLRVVFDRSTEDRYSDPGRFQTIENENGFRVLQFDNDGEKLFLSGQGASPEGNQPFVDSYDLETGKIERLWQSEAPWYETVVRLMDADNGLLITRRESNDVHPNYFLRNIKDHSLKQVTNFPDPFAALKHLRKEIIHYERADGIPLNGTLYLPQGFQPGTDEPLPTLLWAYPREYKSSDAAGQVSGSPYTYIRIGATSPVMLVTQGYALLDNASFPIVGEGDDEPNDTFVEQLVANAEAAIKKLVEMGVSDPERIAISGHSYGAFMTANLLSHSNLFATGIALSGAYNRSLTPFGFQGEERTYWQAPDTYNAVSPFMHADNIHAPILLIHGADDNNSGTFPLQSERYYDALNGHGAIARLVILPHESHGYRARESVLHMHWEWINWLEKYLKNNE
jgi:dipeptidyl aminopeptidase/acylaminoacyl peptidase